MTRKGQESNLVRRMSNKWTTIILTVALVLAPPPAPAANFIDSVFVAVEDTGRKLAEINIDKEKPSKGEKKEKEEKVTGREKETEGKKKYDDFKDKDKNGIDDRFEKPGKPGKEPSKKKKKEDPGEANF